MDRRCFLRGGAIGAAGLAAGRLPQGASGDVDGRVDGARLRLACAGYSFRKELSGEQPRMTLDDLVDFCALHGLDGVELTSYFFRDTTTAYLARLRRRASVNGLAVTGVPIGNDFCLPEGAARAEQLASARAWVERAGRLGAHTVRVFAGKRHRGTSDDEAFDRVVDGLKRTVPVAAEQGVVLTLENHGYLTDTAARLRALVAAVDSPWLAVNLDTGNFRGDAYAEIAAAAPLAVSCQVKVSVRDAAGSKRPCDFGRVVRILREAGYRGFVTLEYEEADDATAAVPRYIAQLREAM